MSNISLLLLNLLLKQQLVVRRRTGYWLVHGLDIGWSYIFMILEKILIQAHLRFFRSSPQILSHLFMIKSMTGSLNNPLKAKFSMIFKTKTIFMKFCRKSNTLVYSVTIASITFIYLSDFIYNNLSLIKLKKIASKVITSTGLLMLEVDWTCYV